MFQVEFAQFTNVTQSNVKKHITKTRKMLRTVIAKGARGAAKSIRNMAPKPMTKKTFEKNFKPGSSRAKQREKYGTLKQNIIARNFRLTRGERKQGIVTLYGVVARRAFWINFLKGTKPRYARDRNMLRMKRRAYRGQISEQKIYRDWERETENKHDAAHAEVVREMTQFYHELGLMPLERVGP